jgi:hypothetical protein
MARSLSLLFLALVAAQAPAPSPSPLPSPLPATLQNPGFDDAAGPGWELGPVQARDRYRLDIAGGAGRLVPLDAAPADAFGAAGQAIDATPWRGKLVRFRVRARLARPGGLALLAMAVRRPPPKSAGFNDYLPDPAIRSEAWQDYQIVGRVAPDAVQINLQVIALGRAALPVAVPIDGRTVSSGEMTAIAFVGRPGARSFGAPSGGFTTGNRQVPLADGATIVLTGSFIRDRTGRDYHGAITPDETVDPALAEQAAVRWLGTQRSCARSP